MQYYYTILISLENTVITINTVLSNCISQIGKISLGQGQVVGSCEHGNTTSSSIEGT
jgi:hypothetical protein